MIVCLGWGSLIWCSKALPVNGTWMSDGPALPVEFARQSRDDRITLVICDGSPAIPVFWAELNVKTVDEGRKVLATREGVTVGRIDKDIGSWSGDTVGNQYGREAVGAWARERNIEGVVWTALGPKIGGERRKPTEQEVINHLRHLSGAAAEAAEEYVRLAPRQIVTPYRAAIEATFGWSASGLV